MIIEKTFDFSIFSLADDDDDDDDVDNDDDDGFIDVYHSCHEDSLSLLILSLSHSVQL